jgi:hypothetical protein
MKHAPDFMELSPAEFRRQIQDIATRSCRDFDPRIVGKARAIFIHTLNTLMITAMCIDPTAPGSVSFHQAFAAALIEGLHSIPARCGTAGPGASLVQFPVHVLTALQGPSAHDVAQDTKGYVLPSAPHYPGFLDIDSLDRLFVATSEDRTNSAQPETPSESTITAAMNRNNELAERLLVSERENARLKEQLSNLKEKNSYLEKEAKIRRQAPEPTYDSDSGQDQATNLADQDIVSVCDSRSFYSCPADSVETSSEAVSDHSPAFYSCFSVDHVSEADTLTEDAVLRGEQQSMRGGGVKRPRDDEAIDVEGDKVRSDIAPLSNEAAAPIVHAPNVTSNVE